MLASSPQGKPKLETMTSYVALELLKILRELPHLHRNPSELMSRGVGITAPGPVAISRPAKFPEVECSGPLVHMHTTCHEAFDKLSIPDLDCLLS